MKVEIDLVKLLKHNIRTAQCYDKHGISVEAFEPLEIEDKVLSHNEMKHEESKEEPKDELFDKQFEQFPIYKKLWREKHQDFITMTLSPLKNLINNKLKDVHDEDQCTYRDEENNSEEENDSTQESVKADNVQNSESVGLNDPTEKPFTGKTLKDGIEPVRNQLMLPDPQPILSKDVEIPPPSLVRKKVSPRTELPRIGGNVCPKCSRTISLLGFKFHVSRCCPFIMKKHFDAKTIARIEIARMNKGEQVNNLPKRDWRKRVALEREKMKWDKKMFQFNKDRGIPSSNTFQIYPVGKKTIKCEFR